MKGFDVGKKLELLHPLRRKRGQRSLVTSKNGESGHGDGGKRV